MANLISELSGRANIAAMVEAVPHRRRSEADGRRSWPGVVSMENAGYQFEAADGSFGLLVRRCAVRFARTSSG